MEIERVSKFVLVKTADRSSSNGRKVLLSLPRVRWLERGEYGEPAAVIEPEPEIELEEEDDLIF